MGPLPACQVSLGEQVRARREHLLPLDASPACCTSLTDASAPVPDQTIDRQGPSRPAPHGMDMRHRGIPAQRTLRYALRLHTC